MSSEVAIRAHGLSKVFPIYDKPIHRLLQTLPFGHKARWHREFQALRGIDLEISRGETVGIVGRNGSGKSTLLQLICGTLTPTEGRVEVNGRIAALLELGTGFNPEFTGLENVYLYGSVLGLTRNEIDRRFDAIAAFADIGDFIRQPVKSYSSGMYVRLAFAVAINVDPEILVVDEALSVGDEAFQRKCFSRINDIRDAGATVLFVSHSAATVVDLCDRAVLLDHGELLTTGVPKCVVSLYQKLLYAPPDSVEAIRLEIRNGSALSRRIDSVSNAAPTPPPPLPDTSNVDDPAHWVDGLVPASTVVYAGRGATIEDAHLSTLDGRRVNVLSEGREYVYSYTVRTQAALAAVRCGMMIRSLTGIDIAGAATAPSRLEAVSFVEAGTTFHVQFRFRCMLAPGTYFLNAGVLASVGAGEEYVARYLDVAMFRVMAEPGRVATGFVNLDVLPNLSAVS
ncbi:MAG: ABC transporter ATP-binding protein [Pseudomonadota bacterium]